MSKLLMTTVLVLTLGCAGLAMASTATSAFDNFDYSYTITPDADETLRSFHVYTGVNECDLAHYYDVIMPAGWVFTTVPMEDKCVLTFFTEGDPLPVGEVANFGFTHYCAPCCHSWFVSDAGNSDPQVTEIDSDENHNEPCNIAPEWASCEGGGLLLAPIYPISVDNDVPTWSRLKAQYR